jgi:hypothetical protein
MSKEKQCANLEAPVLVCFTTFNSFAAMLCFKKTFLKMSLLGETKKSLINDNSTELRYAPFLISKSVSGLLFYAPSMNAFPVRGILNPKAAREFNPKILPEVAFGRVDVNSATVPPMVSWSKGDAQ